jgi:outer membrane protein assembly factor BamA
MACPGVRAYTRTALILTLLAGVSGRSLAQEQVPQADIGDIFSKRRLAQGSEPLPGKLYLAVLPILGYAPANGFIVGVGLAGSMLLDSGHHTHISTSLANIQFTTQNQINFNFRSNIYTPRDRWIFQGDWRYLIFSQPTYGLGIAEFPPVFVFNGVSPDEESGSQPMRFNYLRFYETAYRRIYKRLYAGLGIQVDRHTRIADERLDLNAEPPFFTSHYIYSNLTGFDTASYITSGFALKALLDSRDNANNAFKGVYAELGLRVNTTWLGSDAPSQMLNTDLRTYRTLGSERRVLAFWLLGNFLLGGQVPYLALNSIGWDTYNRAGRGYVQGRFRGENALYGETEYRFAITRNGLLGGVLFANFYSADNRFTGQALLDKSAFGYGAGLRVKMSKEARTNICIDYGLGSMNSSGLYFGLQEVF